MQEELNRCEGRASKLDLQRIALDGDIQRLQMVLQEKENHLRNCQERLDGQSRAMAQIEDRFVIHLNAVGNIFAQNNQFSSIFFRCVALKTSVDQLKERLQSAAITETELRSELTCIQKERSEQSHNLIAGQDKVKHLQKALSSTENERHLFSERLESAQATINELHRNQQSLQDHTQRLQDQVAELEVQKSTVEAQLRIAKWNQGNTDQSCCGHATDDLSSQLLKAQREKNELRLKVEMLNEKLRQVENDKLSKFSENAQFDREKKHYDDGEYDSNRVATDKFGLDKTSLNYGLDYSLMKQENQDLKIKIRRLETLLAEKESEVARLRTKLIDASVKCPKDDTDKYRLAQLQSERLLDAREQHHRQQIVQLENQVCLNQFFFCKK